MTDQSEPDFAHAFKWAIVRLATYVENSTSRPRLLFGSVSVLATERPRPQSGQGVDQHKVARGRQDKVFFRRTVLSVQDAITWYRSASSAHMRTPIPSDSEEVHPKLDGMEIVTSGFFDDPEWPSLGIPVGPDLLSVTSGTGIKPAPFVGSGSEPARIHRRFGDNTGFDALIKEPDAIAYLERRLHIDLEDYKEYLGSLVLIVPDPILRRVDHFIVPADINGSEKLVFRLLPRAGAVLDDLSLTVFELRANLLSRFETVKVPSDGLLTLERQLPVQSSGYVVRHPDYGVLVHQPPVFPIRSINISFGITGRNVIVETPTTESPRSPIKRYEVSEVSDEHPIIVGDASRNPDFSRVIEAEVRREQRAQAQRYDQTWFNKGERDAALGFIRSRISRARNYVLVADPYFGARQLSQFLQAVTRTDITIRILTSRLAFESDFEDPTPAAKSKAKSGAPNMASTEASQAEKLRLSDFSKGLEKFKERGIAKVSTLVLVGKVPPLHDRFLVIDDAIWFLGNSLNALGDRASLILKVPDSEPILKELEEMTTKAQSFDKHFEQRCKSSAKTKRKK